MQNGNIGNSQICSLKKIQIDMPKDITNSIDREISMFHNFWLFFTCRIQENFHFYVVIWIFSRKLGIKNIFGIGDGALLRPSQGFWGFGEKGYLFSGIWGEGSFIFRDLGRKQGFREQGAGG